jgi:flagellar hook-associated protein 1
MTSSLFSIGVSGLNAAQFALTTTGENISNVNTQGYDTENVVTAESPGRNTGAGFLGSGVDVQTVARAFNQLLTNQLNQAQSQGSSLTENGQLLGELNSIFGSPTAGLTTSISGFFNGLQTLSSSTTSSVAAARSAFIGDATSLADQLNNVSQQFTALNQNINQAITGNVTQVNTLATQIAQLNSQIQLATAEGQGQPPNQLLDERDQAVSSLSQLVGTTVVTSGTSINVYIGSGQALVAGQQAFQLQAVPSPSDPSQTAVAYNANPNGGGTPTLLSDSSLTGGTLGGLLTFRSQSLEPAETSVNALAASIAGAVNQQNELGVNESGQQGGPLFSIPGPNVIANANNTGTGTVGASVINPGSPPSDNLTLSFNGTNYTVRDQTTGATSTFAAGTTFPVSAFGVSISLSGTLNAGDSFNIQPNAGAASGIALTTSDPSQIAAAVPVLASASTNNAGNGTITQGSVSAAYFSQAIGTELSGNTGSGTISVVTSSPTATPLAAPVTFQFTAGPPGTYTAVPATAVTITVGGTTTAIPAGTAIPYTAGQTVNISGQSFQLGGAPATGDQFVVQPNAPLTSTTTLTYQASSQSLSGFPPGEVVTEVVNGVTTTFAPPVSSVPYNGSATTLSFGGISVTVGGTPKDGDTFTIAPSNGASDTRNAAALAALQTADVAGNGTETIGTAYSVIVSQVGTQASGVTTANAAQTALISQFSQQQQSVSGVNLDQEAANLVQFQNIYQANSKVIAVATSLFDTILALQ